METSSKFKKPRLLLFILQAFGIGINRQHFFHWFILVATFLAELWDMIVYFDMPLSNFLKSAILTTQMTHSLFVIVLLVKRKAIQVILTELFCKMSRVNLKRLKRIEVLSVLLILAVFIINLSYEVFVVTRQVNEEVGTIFHSLKVNVIIYWVLTAARMIILAFHDLIFFVNASLYLICFFALHCLKMQQLGRLKELVKLDKKVFFKSLFTLEEEHQQFESTFSLALLLAMVFNFVKTLVYIYCIAIIGLSASSFFIIFLTFDELTIALAIVAIILIISDCQKVVSTRALSVCNSIFLDTFSSHPPETPNLLIMKVDSVFNKPVTVWDIVNVSRNLIIATFSSFFVFSILIVQIDNGAMGNVANYTKSAVAERFGDWWMVKVCRMKEWFLCK